MPMDWIEGFNGAAKNFIDCIISGEQPVMDFHFARKVLRAALGVYQVVGDEHAFSTWRLSSDGRRVFRELDLRGGRLFSRPVSLPSSHRFGVRLTPVRGPSILD